MKKSELMSKQKLGLLLFLLPCFFLDGVRVLIKIPTRSRPLKFFTVLDDYIQKLSGKHEVQFLISCDSDDTTMNNEGVVENFSHYKNLAVFYSNGKGKIEAVNRDINKYLGWFDVLIVGSDDMVPIQQNYDDIIAQKMAEAFPDYDGILNFFDGHCGDELSTLPILGKRYYERFQYVYQPEYLSVCCDLELTLVSKLLGKYKFYTIQLFDHQHPAWGKAKNDELYKINDSQKFFVHDKNLLRERFAHNFGLNFDEIKQEALPTSLDLFGTWNPNDVEWTILICTLEERKEKFAALLNELLDQIEKNRLHSKVEVKFFLDNKEHRVGYKRNKLLYQAAGKYVCFIDDDDWVSEDYIAMIHRKLQENKDCVQLKGIITFSGKNKKLFIHSQKYQSYFEKNSIYYRPPNHLNPIKREIVQLFKFPVQNFAEDSDFAMQICESNLIKSEAAVDKPYYFYRYDSATSVAVPDIKKPVSKKRVRKRRGKNYLSRKNDNRKMKKRREERNDKKICK